MKRSLLILALAIGCGYPENPPPTPRTAAANKVEASAPVETDRDAYSMQEGPFGPEVVIETTFRAPADQDVFLANCNGAFTTGLQQRVGDEWIQAWTAEINGCASSPIVIPAGEALTTTITAASGAHAAVDSRNNSTRIDGGTYRVVWHGLHTSLDAGRPFSYGDELPLDKRVSRPFTIQPPPEANFMETSPAQRPAEIAEIAPAHQERVDANASIHVRFSLTEARLAGAPHLYVDREWIGEGLRIQGEEPGSGELRLDYVPSRGWQPGRHDVRVIYRDEGQRTRWYAWSFLVDE